jgi:hypothetical protein
VTVSTPESGYAEYVSAPAACCRTLADVNNAFRAAVTKPEGFVKAVVTMSTEETR